MDLSVPFVDSVRRAVTSCNGDFFKICYGFKPDGVIGRGATSSVVKTQRERGVGLKAVKVLSKTDKYNRLSFEAEVHILSQIRHEHIVEMYLAYDSPDSYIIGMPLYQGGRLRDILRTISWKQTDRIVMQMASAVQYLHNNGVVHRDIKPENILLKSPDGDAVLIDFGMARAVGWGTVELTRCVGTQGYFAPEVSKDNIGSFINWQKCDMYSLGVVLWSMVMRQRSMDDLPKEMIGLGEYQRPNPGSYLYILELLLKENPNQRWNCNALVKHLKTHWAKFGYDLSIFDSNMPNDLNLVDLNVEDGLRSGRPCAHS